MALTTCPDCAREVSTDAASCPGCGRPMRAADKPTCPKCGHQSVENVDGLKGFENVVAICLLLVFIIPGIAYYFDRTRLSWCSSCHHRVPKQT